MGAEVVALGLEEVGGESLAAITIVGGQGGVHGRQGGAGGERRGGGAAPARLAAFDLAAEIRIEQEIGELRIAVERLLDLAEERTANDATAAPHQRHASLVDLP